MVCDNNVRTVTCPITIHCQKSSLQLHAQTKAQLLSLPYRCITYQVVLKVYEELNLTWESVIAVKNEQIIWHTCMCNNIPSLYAVSQYCVASEGLTSSCVDSYVQSLPSSGEEWQHEPQIQFIPLNMTTHTLSITRHGWLSGIDHVAAWNKVFRGEKFTQWNISQLGACCTTADKRLRWLQWKQTEWSVSASEVTKTSWYQHNLSVVLLTDDHYATAHVSRMKH